MCISIAIEITEPGKPGRPIVNLDDKRQVTIEWIPPDSDGGSQITQYSKKNVTKELLNVTLFSICLFSVCQIASSQISRIRTSILANKVNGDNCMINSSPHKNSHLCFLA